MPPISDRQMTLNAETTASHLLLLLLSLLH